MKNLKNHYYGNDKLDNDEYPKKQRMVKKKVADSKRINKPNKYKSHE